MGKRVVIENPDNNHHHQHVTPVTTGQRNIRKRKCNSNITNSKNLRMNSSHNNYWHENDDEDSSSNDGPPLGLAATPRNASSKQANNSSILLNNSLNLSLTQNDNNSTLTESPKPVYTLRPSVVNGTIMYDLTQKPWRLGRPIGKGNFGEIFLASDNISIPVTNENAKFVVKIEPHSNGPLFVEIHCLMNTAKKNHTIKNEDESSTTEKHETEAAAAACSNIPKGEPSGIPDYIASGSHYFGNARYRFLVLPRFDRDLHSLIKKCRVHQKSVLTLAIHIINVLENLHDRGYCHNDVKAQNLMISKCKYLTQQQKQKKTTTTTTTAPSSVYSNRENVVAIGKEKRIKTTAKYDDHYDEKQQTTDSGNSSEQEANDDDDEDFVVKRKVYNSKDLDRDYEEEDDDESPAEEDDDEDEDFDDGATTNSMNSNSMDTYQTPLNRNKQQQRVKGKKTSARNMVQYSGSNPVRSCRREKTNTIYDEMVKSHYLRPTKRISYSEFFNEDGVSVKSHEAHDENSNSYSDMHSNSSDDESEEFVPLQVRRSIRSTAKKSFTTNLASRRLTRRQEKLLGISNNNNNNTNTKREHQANNEDDQHKIKTERNDHQQQQEQTEKQEWFEVNEERIFLIDYGLASKYIDNGVHRPFVMDQRRAHDGTLEFTSRDAHMGAHSRRSDMECLGYNLLFWSQGYLPWKEAATNQQQEKVHRAKEFLMTDVRELLRQIYGKQVPKYLGEYLHLVGQLAYHERPDYARYRSLFEREYQQLGYSLNDLSLNMHEIQSTCVRVKEEIENKNDFFETNKSNGVPCNMVLNIMQNLSVGGTPFHERTLSNRVSPKNLRSKSDKKGPKQKKFSWTEILSQDPDQIARERAEKEFDREEELSEVQQPMVRRYQGKPTTAIILILALLGRSSSEYEEETARLEREYKEKHHKVEKMEVDECDNGKQQNNMAEDEDDEEYRGQSGDENETDATETSEQNTRHKSIQKQRTTTTTKRSKTTTATTSSKTSNVNRKLILKTPNNEATNSNGNNNNSHNTSLTVTPVCARTRGRKANTTVKKSTKSTTTTKLAKSTKKRGSATTIKSVGRKPATTGTTSGTAAAAASAAGEIEQNQEIKRERRTRRRLLNTELNAMESHDDDSNSNLSPDIWKMNTEVIYSRNCKK